MSYQHKTLASGRWNKLSLIEQLANIGSEIERTILWQEKGNKDYSQKALERGLELLSFTIADPKNRERLKELTRVRELLIDYFEGENQFSSSSLLWRKYFYPLTYATRLRAEGDSSFSLFNAGS